MTLKQAKLEFRKQHPNLRVNGWDERDYQLSSQLQGLPSYGLIANDRIISLKEAIALLKKNAEVRFKANWEAHFTQVDGSTEGGK